MGLCVGILENQIEEAVQYLDTKKYVFKFLKESDGRESYLESLGIKILRDCLLFSGSNSYLRANRFKTKGNEIETCWREMISNIFYEERQLAIVNDFYDYPHMVLVFPVTFDDTTRQKEDIGITLNEDQAEIIMKGVLQQLEDIECIPVATLDRLKLNVIKDDGNNMQMFKLKQEKLKTENQIRYKEQLISNFEEAFKFRLITYYTKLREYGLNDIMRKLDELGYLDERFDGDIYLYEEEARKILARRLCAISYKNDIELLIQQGIYDKSKLTYNLNV